MQAPNNLKSEINLMLLAPEFIILVQYFSWDGFPSQFAPTDDGLMVAGTWPSHTGPTHQNDKISSCSQMY